MVVPVPETINFPKSEEEILDYWKEIDAFRECLRQSKGKPRYSFYDGPPFATGLPHYGHILAGSIKDVVTRYAHQNGFHVERRFGWDCHGLPVEFEIDKTLGIKGPEDVAKMGIEKYNDECRKIVMRYSKEWKTIITRLGRWIDFENDYKTLYPWFMESVWWVFSELWNKGLVYRGVKVMPYSTACNTPLSNFESGQNYKDVVDPAVVVTFPMVSNPDVSFLAWTTTPWTLPSNLALCVNPNLIYVKVSEKSSHKIYILMEKRLSSVFKSEDDYTIIDKFAGSTLKGERYVPLFQYYGHIKTAFQVLVDTYVTEESGTGVVHQAPYFGEDDNRVCLGAGVITKDQEPVCPVDASGKFTLPVTDFVGQYVKDADKEIMKLLKKEGRLFSAGTTKHSYPFCWRSDTPLIYKAVPSWFIRVQQMTQQLMAANHSTYWVPDFVKEKRFGNWLKEARDWAVSRNRYWGTPIPLWVSDDMEEFVCISSVNELEKLSGIKVTDLHRETVDKITIPSNRPGQPPLKRVPEVFDCWFESGSMPYAQIHFPFENVEDFDSRFPADFIAEGIDQTRGWFYTLLVISTALFNKAPFKNLIANGLVLASDGQKMSKSKKNYPDPMEVVNKFGADALRLYLINSPVVRAENLRFKEEGVRDILKDVFLPWYNAYRFFIQNVERINADEGIQFSFDDEKVTSSNLMDKWILSFTQSLCMFVRQEMAAYRLYTVVPRLVQFIDNLTNWYVRMNRRRLKGESGLADCKDALSTLGSVLYAMVRLMAPYTPFLTELMFKNLKLLTNKKEKSVHFVLIPQPRTALINKEIESAVERMQTVIELGRIIRDRKTIPIKYPLKEIVVILNSSENITEVEPFKKYILEELNVKSVEFTTDKLAYGVTLRAEPDHKTLGARLKGQFKTVMQAIKELKDSDLQKFQKEGKITVLGETLKLEDLRIFFSFTGPAAATLSQKYETHSNNDILVLLDISPDDSMVAEGTAREIINRVQKLRKKAHLVPTDKISVHYKITPPDSELATVSKEFSEYIENALKAPFLEGTEVDSEIIIRESQQLKGAEITIVITKPATNGPNECQPVCRYVNVYLCEMKPCYGISGTSGCVLLENPVGENVLNLERLTYEIQCLFGLQGRQLLLRFNDGSKVTEESLKAAHQQSICVYRKDENMEEDSEKKCSCPDKKESFVKVLNVQYGEKKGTLLLENPSGDDLHLSQEELKQRARMLFSINKNKITMSVPENGYVIVS